MELEEFVQIVEDMACQHAYPGYEIRSLNMGLPAAVLKSPAKLFGQALKHENVLVKLAALRWFWERPGVSGPHLRSIIEATSDEDEWVRLEAVRVLGRLRKLDEKSVLVVAERLKDSDVEVRRAAARALGRLSCKSDNIISLL